MSATQTASAPVTTAASPPATSLPSGPRLRVLHVALSLNPGGAERLVIDLAVRARSGFETAVCCLDERGAWSGELDRAGVPVHVLGRAPGFQVNLGPRIARLAARMDVDVLHCHQYTPFVYGCLAKLVRPSLHLVFTEHGRLAGAKVSPKRRIANTVLGRMPGRFFAVCDELKRFLVTEGFPARRLGVLYNGIDAGSPATAAERAEARRRLKLDSDDFVVGSVARLDQVKDLGTLVAAFRSLRDGAPAARSDSSTGEPLRERLVLIGDGPERQALEAQVRASGLEEAVLFTGARNDVRELLPAFDVYANSSTYEGVSLTIVEALAAQLPVVATRVGGTPEVLQDGVNATLVPAADPSALSAALRSFRNAPERADRIAAAGRRTVEQRFRFDDMLASYASAYRAGVTR